MLNKQLWRPEQTILEVLITKNGGIHICGEHTCGRRSCGGGNPSKNSVREVKRAEATRQKEKTCKA